MPEISRFLGIKIFMYLNEHNPPHFHIQYNEYKAMIDIHSLGIIEGKIPPRVRALVVEWGEIHQNELLENWNTLQKDGNYKKILPLVQ